MDDEAHVAAHADGPEVLVFGLVEAMKAQARTRRVHLEIERGGLSHLLLVGRQARQTLREGVSDEEGQAPLPTAPIPTRPRPLDAPRLDQSPSGIQWPS